MIHYTSEDENWVCDKNDYYNDDDYCDDDYYDEDEDETEEDNTAPAQLQPQDFSTKRRHT